MAANSDYIPLTLRLSNQQYKEFHAVVEMHGGCKTKVLRLLVAQYVAKETASTRKK